MAELSSEYQAFHAYWDAWLDFDTGPLWATIFLCEGEGVLNCKAEATWLEAEGFL